MSTVAPEVELAACLGAIGQSHDRAAFARVFDYYAPQLKSYFRKRGTADSTADDLVQETMLKLWDKALTYDPQKGSPSSWVFTIARNAMITRLRDRRLAPLPDELLALEDPAPKADMLIAERQAEARLREVLESLPERQADILKASFFEDRSHTEIARDRSMPLGTVKSYLRRTLIQLRAALVEAS